MIGYRVDRVQVWSYPVIIDFQFLEPGPYPISIDPVLEFEKTWDISKSILMGKFNKLCTIAIVLYN